MCNRKCNALQSVLGIFLHSTNVPEKAIQVLAHMGISVSVSSLHRAIHSLSCETYENIRKMGQTLLVAYAYDNFDIDFSTHLSTIEKAKDTLTHLTSGCLIQLDHNVTLEDLRCSNLLWERSPLNHTIPRHLLPPQRSFFDLLSLHPEPDHPSGLTRCQRFFKWKFLTDLCDNGPKYFCQFGHEIPSPEAIEQIPIRKMRHAPARAMDINQSRVSGNIQAISALLTQGGVGDPEDNAPEGSDVVDVSPYVVLIHGDLGTAERVVSLLECRSLEGTPWRRFQYVVFVLGLFHLKMACADALWRIFIEPRSAWEDPNGLMHLIAIHRPRETGLIGSHPGFRRMHDVIVQEGIAFRLDAWRVEAQKRDPLFSTLEAFAASSPSLELLKEMAHVLAIEYVKTDEAVARMQQNPETTRDQQHENILLLQHYFLLYEEISFAMNEGDIGRVETLFPPWICLFKATGKHKYATHMVKFLTDIHFMYPPGLRYVDRSI